MKINADRQRVLAVSFDGEVTRIETEKIILPSEDDISTSYFRTVRLTTHTGEDLEVFCDAETQKKLELLSRNYQAAYRANRWPATLQTSRRQLHRSVSIVEVDQLGPVGRVRTKSSWLKPRVSKGT